MKTKNLFLSLFLLFIIGNLHPLRARTPQEKEMKAYLLVYFKDTDHDLHMAISPDGYTFTDINNGNPVMLGDTIALQKGIRDPHIYRGPDGAFYLTMTDLHIYAQKEGLREEEWMRPKDEYGWGNNRALVLMKSYDLIHWTRTNIRIDQLSPELGEIGCAWAPETIYDEEKGKMMIYFTMRFRNEEAKMYYVYTNEDFNKIESLPTLLFDHPQKDISAIDGDITKIGNKYHLFYACNKGIMKAVSDKLTGDYQFDPTFYDSEEKSCEAPNVWKRIGEDKWVLMYDIFGIKPNNFGFRETSDFKHFTDLGRFNEGVMKATNFNMPKHGAVIQLTEKEANDLCKYWNCPISFGETLPAQEYPKVILRGDYADPTILRDGKDFYMTHSAFVYAPGFLIWHSTDLINWQPLVRTMTDITGSAYAPDLVKHGDTYYIYYPSNGTNYVIWAKDIKGPWSKPVDLKLHRYIDPGHIVGEDGKRYLHLNRGDMIQLTDDGLATVGEVFHTYSGWQYPEDWDVECFCLESPKLTYKDGYYYLTSAEGGTAGPATSHMVVSARSKSVKGPWENSPYNPIVHTYSASEQWWSKGHGTLIDDAEGNWWMVYHAYENGAYTLGRQTLIEPVEWLNDGWFRSMQTHKPVHPTEIPAEPSMELSDDFNSEELSIQWTTWGKYNRQDFELKDGKLYIQGKGTSPKDSRLLLVTVPDKSYQIETQVDLMNSGTGGLVLYYNEKAFAGIVSDGKQFIVYKNANEQEKVPNTFGKHFFVRIINEKHNCTLQVSRDGTLWETIKKDIDVSGFHHNNYRGFYSLKAGLIATGDATVAFNDFRYTPLTNKKNPVLKGLYADPEILYSQKDKKYYIYPTSDGYKNWEGWYFKTFSSDNLKDWKDEGVILDLKKDVPWAGGRAWAPCIIEKKGRKKGEYKYYFYYTGAGKIGVAVANEPIGPFVDSGAPLLDQRPEGTNRGAVIDPDVFHDPVSGKDYLYWGNGFLAVAELNKDMISIKKKTLKLLTPPQYSEGTYVFYRKGLYYFLWSKNDTRSEDYQVRYGTSKSPTGPISIPENNLILSKVPEKGIYGTGHNSVLQMPGTDEWYIVYHRFNRPNGIKMGRDAGYNREVCIDKMEFNEDGSIVPITPLL